MLVAGTSRRPARRAAALALLGACVLASGCSPAKRSPGLPAAAPATTAAVTPDWSSLREKRPATPSPGVSTVAEARVRRVGIYATPGAPAPEQALANPQPSGAPLVFLVRQRRAGWLQVLLPVRPNGSTGWIRAGEVRLARHHYRIVVALKAHQLTVYRGNRVVEREPIAVGKRDTPTPGGLYYTKELLRAPDPTGPYGPYAYGLSGFSNVLRSFAGGDAVIGIHGTNNPGVLGHDVSHGCIRMSNASITRLARLLPLGVPVQILA
jgi:lipoprotein-anchoring transpeptidase ErfK/SrfK